MFTFLFVGSNFFLITSAAFLCFEQVNFNRFICFSQW